MRILILFVVILLGGMNCMNAQDITQLKWKNRILLLLVDSFENDSLHKQKEHLFNFSKELEERKLIIYEVSPSYYRTGVNTDRTELGTATLFEKYNTENKLFKLILKGLDGSIKLEKDTTVDPTDIFELIDQMPMRQYELKNN